MKRISNLYSQIYAHENLEIADIKARRKKKSRYGIMIFDRDRNKNLHELSQSLKNHTYKTSKYDIFKMVVDSGKEREIYRLPYYPDRICHHAIMKILEPIWVNCFTADTYACIKGRGIHGAALKLKKLLRTKPYETSYCLKMDIRKFYPSVDHGKLKKIVRKKIKDNELLWLLDEIIDSAPGLPIGNYLSQFFANLYLTYFDHWIKEVLHVKYYFRYCDDMVILHESKNYLHEIKTLISNYLTDNLNLTMKNNWQVFPVDIRGIDFLGYRFYHTHTLLRKTIKQRFARKAAKLKKVDRANLRVTLSSYWGWAKHCNSINLIKKLSI